jgi:hypothetical protein
MMGDTNVYKFQTVYIPPFGGETQDRKNIVLNGGTMNDLLKDYRLFLGMTYRKPNTQLRYLNSAEKYLGFIQEISKDETQRYVAYLNQTMRPNAVTSNIVGLNRYLEYLKRPDLRVPTPSWKRINRDTISRDDIVRMLEHARKTRHYMDYLMLLFIRDMDTRNHELTRLRWDWIKDDKVFFRDCKTGDTVGWLTRDLKDALGHWRTVTPAPCSPYVFVVLNGRYKGSALSEKGWYIRDLVNRVSSEVVGRRLNPQDLRSSVITSEWTAYVNPEFIQRKARHRSKKTTEWYNHPSDEEYARYIANGTIFGEDAGSLLSPKSEFGKSKRGYINNFLAVIPSTLTEEMEDNTRFSFSVTFFVDIMSVTGLMVGGVSDKDPILSSTRPPPHHMRLFFIPRLEYTHMEAEGTVLHVRFPPNQVNPGLHRVSPQGYFGVHDPDVARQASERRRDECRIHVPSYGRSNHGQVMALEYEGKICG